MLAASSIPIMWLFKGREDDDSDFESDDYDSDEYETDDEELDSAEEDDPSVIDDKNKQVDDMPERAETEEDLSEEEIVQENGKKHANAEGDSQSEEDESSIESQESDEEGSHHADNEQLDESKDESVDDLEESREESVDEDEEASDEEDDDEEEATSLAEKQALLSLASENDRVDILKAILTPEDRDALLNSSEGDSLPPLHVAISYGSTHATSCLLRMGANPAIRPVTRDKRYAGMSAWELAFGAENESKSDEPPRTIKPVDMAPSKREGIRHAFTAEALRCIGSDEVERLQHLLDSGMPSSIDIGGKDLHGWSIEMGALKCKELTRPFAPEPREESQEEETSESETTQKEAPRPSAVVSHLDSDSLLSLDNRLEELDSLSKALSSCLDNLAEEVSVCHGLLLLGGGASALASHVRSLKVLKERRETELEQWVLDWNDSQDELAYWLQENGGADGFDDDINMATNRDLDNNERKRSFTPPESEEDEESQRRQLKAQIAASENKVSTRTRLCRIVLTKGRKLTELSPRFIGPQTSSIYR